MFLSKGQSRRRTCKAFISRSFGRWNFDIWDSSAHACMCVCVWRGVSGFNQSAPIMSFWSHHCGPAQNLVAPHSENCFLEIYTKTFSNSFLFCSLRILGASYSKNVGPIPCPKLDVSIGLLISANSTSSSYLGPSAQEMGLTFFLDPLLPLPSSYSSTLSKLPSHQLHHPHH